MDRITVAISLKIIGAHWRVVGLLSAPLWAFAPSWVAAGPVGGQIVGGRGSITHPNSNLTEIHQGSDRLAIDWQQFNVNANDVVKFVQPSSQSIALNRILDSKQSLILGRIEANGRIFLVNPRGIIFGKDATVNVAGLVASSLDIDSRNFINGKFAFSDKGGEGVIVNQGTIEAAVGGAVVLLGKVVINEGDIRTPRGSTHLVSAGGAVISFDDNEQIGIQITAQQQQKIENQTDAVRNSGSISAPGGYIALTGATAADLFTNAVNNEGVLVANSVRNRNGVIELTGGDGSVAQSGVVDVSGAANTNTTKKNNGGKISISGNDINDTGKLIAGGANGGAIQLHAQDLILTENNAAISATGSSGKGGHIELLADRVGVMDNSRIDASGATGGGVVHVGGAFHGENNGTGPRNAQRTVVDDGVSIYADATKKGNGGEVVLWSDDVTYFVGNIFARGGANGGDGGNVETSGKQSLSFNGYVDTSAPHGKMGNLLLDPAIINIIAGGPGANDASLPSILAGTSPGATFTISQNALQALTSSVTLQATQQINIANLGGGTLLFNPNGGTVTFDISSASAGTSFTMANVNDEIRVNNGNLVISSGNTGTSTMGTVNFTLGKLTTSGAGNISVTANSSCSSSSFICSTGATSMSGGAINAAGTVTLQGISTVNTPNTVSSSGNVTMAFGSISAGSDVSVTGTSSQTSTGAIATSGNVSITTGNINSGGTVTVNGQSNASTGAASVTGGTAAATVGQIISAGAVTLGAASTATGSLPLLKTSKAATVTAQDISVTGNAPIQITASSSADPTLETVNIGGNYIENGGSFTVNTYTLNLTNNTVIDTAGTINLAQPTNYTVLNLNGFTLTQGAINNIYIGDISGSALAGDLGFSQANITAFAGTGFVLSAHNSIFLGNATINSPSATSIQLIADNDHNGTGDISIAAGKTFNLNGRNLIASGVNATIDGIINNSGTGSQQITAASAITMGSGASLTSGSGNISLNAGAGITMANNAAIASTSGQLALTAANNIALGTLTTGNATTSAVNVTSTGGAISNAGAATNISANAAGSRVTLSALSGINAALSIADLTLTNSGSGAVSLSNNRALQISSFTNTPVTAASVTTTGVGSDITIAGNVSSGSDLTFTSSGAFTVNNGNTVNSNAGTLTINAAGNAAITGLTTTNNTASAISVTSTGGAITDAGADNLADITTTAAGSGVTLTAATGIGSANAIDLNLAGSIGVSNSASGNIGLHALNSYTFNSINYGVVGGAVALSSDGNLTINNITTNNGAIGLSAFDNVSLAAGTALQSSGGNVSITADTNSNSVGAINMGTGTINSGSGTITLNAAQDIGLNTLTTTNATTSAVSITSTAGKILGNFDGIADIAATSAGSRVTLNAHTGINGGVANPLELSILDLIATNTTSGGINLTNNRALQISGLTNAAATATTITATGVGSDLNFVGTLQNGGGNATLTATRNIDLQNVTNVAALSTNSAAVNYAQSISVGSISSTGTATVAGNLTATIGNIDLQTVALGAGAHTFSTIGGNDINLGAITGNSNLQLSGGRNITLASAALGAGNFSAASAANGTFTANGTIGASAVTLNQFSTANLLGVVAGNTLDVAANIINLSGDLISAGALTLTGTTQLQNDILLSEAGSGGLLQLAGSVIGNAHALTITAGGNTVCIACSAGASASGLAALDIQSSIKTVLGATSVNGNATINADQEIYLNGDTAITGNLALLADANNDGIGIAGLLTGKQLSVGGTLTIQPIALSSLATPAQCAAPTGLPQMPSSPQTPNLPQTSSSSPPGQPAFLTKTDVQIAIQESDQYGLAASDAMLRNVSQIAYLGNNCQTDLDTHNSRGQCDVDASMLDFLGTFLIDNQIPKNGRGQ